MTLNNININMFLEFPGILITIGVICLLISIIIIITVYISENKMQNIKVSELSPNYDYIPVNETTMPEPNYSQPSEVANPVIIQQFEPQMDAFATEFSNNDITENNQYESNKIINIKPEIKEETPEPINIQNSPNFDSFKTPLKNQENIKAENHDEQIELPKPKEEPKSIEITEQSTEEEIELL